MSGKKEYSLEQAVDILTKQFEQQIEGFFKHYTLQMKHTDYCLDKRSVEGWKLQFQGYLDFFHEEKPLEEEVWEEMG